MPKKKKKEETPQEPKQDVKKAINKLLTQYEKKYKIVKGSSIVIEPKLKTIFPIDYLLDGGFSQAYGGHKIEFAGRESSGKTTFSLIVTGKYQKQNKKCAFINAENSYDPEWAEILGVDNSKLLVASPESLEEAGDMLLEMVKDFDLIIIDSVVALTPEEEIGESLSDKRYAPQAKVLSPLCRQLNRMTSKYKTTIIFINQVRENVGQKFGNPETTGGGRALKHLYDSRVWFRTGKPFDIGSGEKKERVGKEIKMECKKNKKGKPNRTVVVDFWNNGVIDIRKNLFFAGLKYGVIDLAGQTYSFKDKKVRGQDNFRAELTDKDYEEIEKEIWKSMAKRSEKNENSKS